jgi:hypothetical protein
VSKAAAIACMLILVIGAAGADETPARDPMRPFGRAAATAAAAAVNKPRFELTAVLIAPTRRVAIVNGKPYREGEVVDGAQIAAIEPAAVRLREHDAEFLVSLGRPEKGPPAIVQGETVP